MRDDGNKTAWEDSYGRKENYVFSPSEEVVRFVSRYLRQRKGIDEIIDVLPGAAGSRVLDVGCGIGRSIMFGTQMGLEMWGIDLSEQAISIGRQWLTRSIGASANDRFVCGDVRRLPWADGFFDHAISDSALDSMGFDIAQAGVAEVARVLKPGGYFYCSLVSGGEDDSAKEEIVSSTHERGTIQSYYNASKIRTLVGSRFEILGRVLITASDTMRNQKTARWHVVMQRLPWI